MSLTKGQETELVVNSVGEDQSIEIRVKGPTEMPFWKHDLKLDAIIPLLETIDEKDFADCREPAEKCTEKIIEIRNIIDNLISL